MVLLASISCKLDFSCKYWLWWASCWENSWGFMEGENTIQTTPISSIRLTLYFEEKACYRREKGIKHNFNYLQVFLFILTWFLLRQLIASGKIACTKIEIADTCGNTSYLHSESSAEEGVFTTEYRVSSRKFLKPLCTATLSRSEILCYQFLCTVLLGVIKSAKEEHSKFKNYSMKKNC